jgi:hypothetical protein
MDAEVAAARQRFAGTGIDLRWTTGDASDVEHGVEALALRGAAEKPSLLKRCGRKWSLRGVVHRLFLLLISEQVAVLPLVLCFDYVLGRELVLGFFVSQTLFDAVFLANMIVRIVGRTNDAARRAKYVKSLAFVADVVAAVPCYSVVFGLKYSYGVAAPQIMVAVQVLMWLALLRALQMYRVVAWLKQLRMTRNLHSSTLTLCTLSMTFLLFVHYSACLFYLVAAYEEINNPDALNWVSGNVLGVQPGDHLFNATAVNQYLVAFYVTTLTLVGQPPPLFTAAETAFNLLVILIGLVGLMSVVLAFFVNVVQVMSARKNEVELALDAVNHLSLELGLSERTRKKLQKQWASIGKSDQRFDLSITDHVSLMRPLPFRVKVLTACEIVSGLERQNGGAAGTNRAFYALLQLLSRDHPLFFVDLFLSFHYEYAFDGNLICVAGDVADCCWLLQSGALEVLHSDGSVALVLLAGSIVGIAMFSAQRLLARRSASLRARGTCRLWRIEKQQFDAVTERYPTERLLMADFFVVAHELQMQENASHVREWEDSGVPVSRVRHRDHH